MPAANRVFILISRNDPYELPICCADSARELSRMCGWKSEHIIQQARLGDRQGGRNRFYSVEIPDDVFDMNEWSGNMIKIINGNLADADVDIIAHQVNCQGVMGSGVARCIREKFPRVYELYRKQAEFVRRCFSTSKLLGTNQYVEITDGDRHRVVANMFAQNSYGYDGSLYTDYNALRKCLISLRHYAQRCPYGGRIGLPFMLGCGRGGGDWEGMVYPLIQEILGDLDVVLYRYEGVKP